MPVCACACACACEGGRGETHVAPDCRRKDELGAASSCAWRAAHRLVGHITVAPVKRTAILKPHDLLIEEAVCHRNKEAVILKCRNGTATKIQRMTATKMQRKHRWNAAKGREKSLQAVAHSHALIRSTVSFARGWPV